MTNPNNDQQNAGLPSYSHVTGGPDAAYANYASQGGDNLITDKKNPLALWALVLGIITLVTVITVIASGFAIVPGIVGIILSIIAMVNGKKYEAKNRRTVFSIVGLALSIIGSLISIGVIFVGLSMFGDCLQITDPTAQQQCIQDKISG